MKKRNGRELEEFKKDASVLPILIEDENGRLLEVIACTSISGGKDYEENMPKHLTLVRKQITGETYTVTYTQTEDSKGEKEK